MLKCNSESRNHICYDAGSLKRDWHQKSTRLSQAVLFVGAILQEFSVPARNYLQGNIQRVLIYGFVIFLPRGHLGLSGL